MYKTCCSIQFSLWASPATPFDVRAHKWGRRCLVYSAEPTRTSTAPTPAPSEGALCRQTMRGREGVLKQGDRKDDADELSDRRDEHCGDRGGVGLQGVHAPDAEVPHGSDRVSLRVHCVIMLRARKIKGFGTVEATRGTTQRSQPPHDRRAVEISREFNKNSGRARKCCAVRP